MIEAEVERVADTESEAEVASAIDFGNVADDEIESEPVADSEIALEVEYEEDCESAEVADSVIDFDEDNVDDNESEAADTSDILAEITAPPERRLFCSNGSNIHQQKKSSLLT